MHEHTFSRRQFIWTAAALGASTGLLRSQDRPPELQQPAGSPDRRSVVSLTNGESRRQNVCDALVAIEDQILPVLKTKKHVVIKPNMVSTRNQLASTHVDALHGILDFLAPRFKGPVSSPNRRPASRRKAMTTSATPRSPRNTSHST